MGSYFPCKWFSDNQMKTNITKVHLIVGTNDTAETQIGDPSVTSSGSENLLVVKIGSELSFDAHGNHLCSKASKELRARAKVS